MSLGALASMLWQRAVCGAGERTAVCQGRSASAPPVLGCVILSQCFPVGPVMISALQVMQLRHGKAKHFI